MCDKVKLAHLEENTSLQSRKSICYYIELCNKAIGAGQQGAGADTLQPGNVASGWQRLILRHESSR
jgi:hypothetical protein